MNNKKTEADVTNAIKAEAANARLQSLPGFEVKRWETAETDDDGRRQVTFEYAHTYGRSWLNLEQFCEEVEDRLDEVEKELQDLKAENKDYLIKQPPKKENVK